ncbi:transposase [Streptomyces sp. NPDC058770]|uniref:transposase n=1 Tax=Streptomyces sp. NPDC058770 TaxID=3346631 RepID=UPI0036C88EE6
MGSKYTKRYTEELKRDAIALVDSSGKTVTAVARELGISSESLRGWYRKAKADRRRSPRRGGVATAWGSSEAGDVPGSR